MDEFNLDSLDSLDTMDDRPTVTETKQDEYDYEGQQHLEFCPTYKNIIREQKKVRQRNEKANCDKWWLVKKACEMNNVLRQRGIYINKIQSLPFYVSSHTQFLVDLHTIMCGDKHLKSYVVAVLHTYEAAHLLDFDVKTQAGYPYRQIQDGVKLWKSLKAVGLQSLMTKGIQNLDPGKGQYKAQINDDMLDLLDNLAKI